MYVVLNGWVEDEVETKVCESSARANIKFRVATGMATMDSRNNKHAKQCNLIVAKGSSNRKRRQQNGKVKSEE